MIFGLSGRPFRLGVSQRLQRYKLILFEPNADLVGSWSGADRMTEIEKLRQKTPPTGWVGGDKCREAARFFYAFLTFLTIAVSKNAHQQGGWAGIKSAQPTKKKSPRREIFQIKDGCIAKLLPDEFHRENIALS